MAAALALADMSQERLGALMKADGLGSQDPQEISQGRKEPQLAQLTSMARHLGVPVEWFTAEDFSAWVATGRIGGSGDPAVLADADLAEALAELAEAQQQLQRVQGLLQRGGPPAEELGNG